jgi:hypothetical protein
MISIAVLCVNLIFDNDFKTVKSFFEYAVLSGIIHQKDTNILYILYATKINTIVKKKNT